MGRSLRLITALVLKDWRLFLADRRAAFLCFAVPIVLASAFGIIFDKPSQQVETCRLPLLIVNEDGSAFGTDVVDDLRRSSHVEVQQVDRATAEREVARRPCVAVVLPPRSSEKPKVIVLHHPLATMESQWAEGAVTEVVMKRAAKDFLQPLGLGANVERPFAVERRTLSDGHSFNSRSHSFSGMTLQYLLFWGMECGLLMLRERRQGIWRRVCVSPVPLWAVLLGRALSTASIALLQIAVTFGFGYLVFGVTVEGSLVGFLLLAASVSVLAAGVGLLVASVGRTEASARNVLIVAILGMSMLGGLWLPAFLLPKWVQDWSQCLPTTWAMRGLDGVTWQGQGLGALWPSLLAVNLFAFAFLLAAACRFHLLESRRRRGGVA